MNFIIIYSSIILIRINPRINNIFHIYVFFTIEIRPISYYLLLTYVYWRYNCTIINSCFYNLRKIIPILDTVAGDACLRECVSKIKFIFVPNCILQPDGNVNNLLSSKTEFSDSIHSGSTSPSNIIQDIISIKKG